MASRSEAQPASGEAELSACASAEGLTRIGASGQPLSMWLHGICTASARSQHTALVD